MNQPGGRLLYCHSLAVIVAQWDEMRWDCVPQDDCNSHPVCHVMRFSGQRAFQICHSQTVGPKDIRWPGRKSWCCHSLPVGHGMRWNCWLRITATMSLTPWWRWDEMRWHCLADLSLTLCWSWDEIWWDYLAENQSTVTHSLLVMAQGWDLMRMPGRRSWHCHSQTVGPGCDMMRLPARKHCTVTHLLLVMELHEIRLCELWHKATALLLTFWSHGMWCNETAGLKISALPLTSCCSWHKMW